jgi:CRISPR/Cas system-associated exonuclease Cas4 (RecB family)
MSLKNLAKLVSEATKKRPVEQQFLRDLNETIVRLDAEDNYKPSKTYKPSMLGGCKREVFFCVIGEQEDPKIIDPDDASFIGICESGSDRHERIQKAVSQMERLGYKVKWWDVEEYLTMWPQPGTKVVEKKGMETKLRNEIFNMSFLCDGIIQIDGKFFILEIKTEASFKWQGRVDAVDKHKTQAACYSLTLGIDDVIYIYENRDFCTKKSFRYTVTEEDRQARVIDVIEDIDNYVREHNEIVESLETKSDTIPITKAPPKSDKKSDCNYCDYKKACKRWGE